MNVVGEFLYVVNFRPFGQEILFNGYPTLKTFILQLWFLSFFFVKFCLRGERNLVEKRCYNGTVETRPRNLYPQKVTPSSPHRRTKLQRRTTYLSLLQFPSRSLGRLTCVP